MQFTITWGSGDMDIPQLVSSFQSLFSLPLLPSNFPLLYFSFLLFCLSSCSGVECLHPLGLLGPYV